MFSWLSFLGPVAKAGSKMVGGWWANEKVRRVVIALVLGAVAFWMTWCAGVRHQQRADQLAAYTAKRDTIIKTIRVTDTLLKHDTVKVAATVALATKARATFAKTDSTLEAKLASPDTVAHPDSAPVLEVPVSAVLPGVEACKSALAADSSVYGAIKQLLADTQKKLDAETVRADLAEAQLKAEKPPRFGFKTGAVVGGTLVALAVVFF